MSEYLVLRGYSVWSEPSAAAFYRHLAVSPVDIVILDIGLPGEDGLSVASHLAQSGLGILIVSARSSVTDRLNGMAAGADSYLTKPVDLHELVAHIEALRRRLVPVKGWETQEPTGWSLCRRSRELVTGVEGTVLLTPSEFALLACLIDNNGECSRQQIAGALDSNPSQFNYHRIDVLLSRLRKKVKCTMDRDLPVASAPQQKLQLTCTVAWT
ncbi:MAG: DNA-binding response regulator [Halomonadaceae bacterium]|nr:MAG: DNA-binding response regulator [Halomonadaceae bacterium]